MSNQDRFQSLREELRVKYGLYLAGQASMREVEALALEAASVYNEVATDIAKRFNRKPKLVTAASLIRNL